MMDIVKEMITLKKQLLTNKEIGIIVGKSLSYVSTHLVKYMDDYDSYKNRGNIGIAGESAESIAKMIMLKKQRVTNKEIGLIFNKRADYIGKILRKNMVDYNEYKIYSSFPKEIVQELISLRKNGYRVKEIAKIYKRTPEIIRSYLKREMTDYDEYNERRRIYNDELDEIIILVRQYVPLVEIVKKFNRSEDTIRGKLRHYMKDYHDYFYPKRTLLNQFKDEYKIENEKIKQSLNPKRENCKVHRYIPILELIKEFTLNKFTITDMDKLKSLTIKICRDLKCMGMKQKTLATYIIYITSTLRMKDYVEICGVSSNTIKKTHRKLNYPFRKIILFEMKK